jgi:hypothetical protein
MRTHNKPDVSETKSSETRVYFHRATRSYITEDTVFITIAVRTLGPTQDETFKGKKTPYIRLRN